MRQRQGSSLTHPLRFFDLKIFFSSSWLDKKTTAFDGPENRHYHLKQPSISSWWFQPNRKILVKLEIFPK